MFELTPTDYTSALQGMAAPQAQFAGPNWLDLLQRPEFQQLAAGLMKNGQLPAASGAMPLPATPMQQRQFQAQSRPAVQSAVRRGGLLANY